MTPFDFQPTSRVIFGENAVDQLGALTKELGGRRVLLVTDAGILRAGHVERALHSLKKESLAVFVFSEVEENPTTRHVENGVQFAKANAPVDFLIGLGGGSAMDCAKGINFLLTNGGKMEDYWGVDKASKPMMPSIGIPTTAGTGSEAQSFALISQEQTHIKMACGDKKARFRAVILDPHLAKTAPQKVAAIAGIDAISHAVESYVCTRRNPISQMFAREAWRLLEGSFEVILKEPENIAAQSKMLLGAHLAGAAIENSMLGAAHACANPLTATYGIAHGIAVGLMLPHVVRFNSAIVNEDYAGLLKAAGISDMPQTSGERLIARIVELQTAAGLPQRLRECNVEKHRLPELAKAAASQWTAKFNPRPVAEKELLELYAAVY
ncbi:MAG: iron-containing alcohol dehydrogenase [candidate division KSB1 bacterium]|nr:iron-containing alcohol dehydrogenase [candidate division KSB1 bacterium]MDZ7365159.1 iron-containing alcohol dehydrogenase [candidate division KSB1 bacterium]MDZ7404369.1 iron-containing alcohol dehydrogenase [candidate division KSB1 bacterium]